MDMLRRIFWFVIVLILSILAIVPFFQNGFFPMHDDTQVVRVSQMAKALSDGHFPVRWVKALGYGYGYPIFNFYAPLPYYVGGVLGVLGVDTLMATKAMMFIGILLSSIFMYLLAKQFWGEVGGIVSALFYMYAPYHAVDIYVRGAVGELWAYAFLPLMFLGLYKVFTLSMSSINSQSIVNIKFQIAKIHIKLQKEILFWVIFGAIGFSGIILSHNLTAMMVIPFLILFTTFALVRKQASLIFYFLFSIFLGLGLSAFYWLPALLELQYTNVLSQIGGGANFRDHFLCWQQLWESQWGFGGSAPGCIDGLSFKVGKLHLFILALSILLLILGKIRHFNNIYHLSGNAIFVAIPLFGFFVSVFFMTEPSRFIWEAITPMAFLQYPWRFLVIASFFASFLAGAIVWVLRLHYLSGALLIFLLLFFNSKLFQPQMIMPRTAQDYTNEYNIKWVTSKISDEYMPKDFARPTFEVDTVKRRVSVGEIKVDKTQELVFEVYESEAKSVLVSIAPFPAWKAFVDGESLDYKSTNKGLEIPIPKGRHEVRVAFVPTPIERLSTAVSLISIMFLIGGILRVLWEK